ncbi:hypothetical protein [Hymenobacter wooponensis]|uniref:Pentapeptide MXKDX repeat protein n=1 Tax=Hymenobacter wooponensis TaxID=1525360 RepID=A0A4Z0MU21_9BACT|nr:hypothetical protein [Hymenobacter wooponensis]TGD82605.1 hypothetical protein EU557_02135 [Hymenobacter wooponensis]
MKKFLFSAALAACVLGTIGTAAAQTEMPAKVKAKDNKVKTHDLDGQKTKVAAKKDGLKAKSHGAEGKMKAKGTATDTQ